MSTVHIARSRHDVQFAEQLRVDLALRHWSVEMTAFSVGAAHAQRELKPATPTIVVIPDRSEDREVALFFIQGELLKGNTPILISPESIDLPSLVQTGVGAIIYRDTLSYDEIFEEMYRALLESLPPWLDVRIRPSLIQSPTGVAWWADDIFIADDRFDHVVRISPNDSTVVLPGLSNPHLISVDRRNLVVANGSANEILSCDIVDNMATNVDSIHDVDGGSFGNPHQAVFSSHVSVICDSNNDRVLYRTRRDTAWHQLVATEPFCRPQAVCLDDTGIWIADTGNHRVVHFSFDGTELLAYGRYGKADDSFGFPIGVARWADYLFITDELSERIKVFRVEQHDAELVITPSDHNFGSPWLRAPTGISVNQNNRLAVSDRQHKCVWLIDLSTALVPESIIAQAELLIGAADRP